MRQIVTTYPNKELLEPTREIPKDQINSDTYSQIGSSMVEIMKKKGGVGLSANQVGLPLKMCVIATAINNIVIMLNPRIVKSSKITEDSPEGCLSLPGAYANVKRHNWVEVEYETVDGETISERVSGFKGYVIQHEIDHLNGVLFINRLNEYSKNKALKAMHKFKRKAH